MGNCHGTPATNSQHHQPVELVKIGSARVSRPAALPEPVFDIDSPQIHGLAVQGIQINRKEGPVADIEPVQTLSPQKSTARELLRRESFNDVVEVNEDGLKRVAEYFGSPPLFLTSPVHSAEAPVPIVPPHLRSLASCLPSKSPDQNRHFAGGSGPITGSNTSHGAFFRQKAGMSPKALHESAPKHAGLAASIITNVPPGSIHKGRRRSLDADRWSAVGTGLGTGTPTVDKRFGYEKNIGSKYELEHEIGRGHFGHTCLAKVKKGPQKGKRVAVKIVPKSKMDNAVAVADVKKEIQILKSIGRHGQTASFLDAHEDPLNVYIAMELCEGGELLESILQRGGRYPEKEAMAVIRQILSIVAFCHQQGVVHRDLKPENFLFVSKDPNSALRVIDFGLSDFVRPEQRLQDIVGSAYYIAPEVLHRSYSVEADVWSVGVIAYILLCGSRPFWSRTESGIFRGVLKHEPSFLELPWPHISEVAQDFIRRLLSKDWRRRPTAAQALTHPWVRGVPVPLDIAIYKQLLSFMYFTPLRKAALRALVNTLTEDELVYLRAQFSHVDVNDDGIINLEDLKIALSNVATEAMALSGTLGILDKVNPELLEAMDFNEFCAGIVNVCQLEALSNWQERAAIGYEFFCETPNVTTSVDEFRQEVAAESTTEVFSRDYIKDGSISLHGFIRLLRGPLRPKTGRIQQNKINSQSSALSADDSSLPALKAQSLTVSTSRRSENGLRSSKRVSMNRKLNS